MTNTMLGTSNFIYKNRKETEETAKGFVDYFTRLEWNFKAERKERKEREK